MIGENMTAGVLAVDVSQDDRAWRCGRFKIEL